MAPDSSRSTASARNSLGRRATAWGEACSKSSSLGPSDWPVPVLSLCCGLMTTEVGRALVLRREGASA